MAGSRLDRIGTIFSRATGLLKAGAVKYQDRPLWYDVYRVFPPKYEPHIDRQPERKEISEILYREDKFRALFFKKYGLNPRGPSRNLGDRNSQEPSHSFITICVELCKHNPAWNDEEVFNSAVEKHKQTISHIPAFEHRQISNEPDMEEAAFEAQASRRLRKPLTPVSVQSLRELFKEAKETQEKGENLVKTKSDSEGGNNP